MAVANASTPTQTARVRIQADPTIGKVRRLGQTITVNPRLVQELQTYFITARDLAHKGHFDFGFDIYFKNPRKSLIDVLTNVAKIQAFRDRVTEIQVHLMDQMMSLERWTRIAKAHIYEFYSIELKSRGTAEHQQYFISSLIPGMFEKLETIKASLKMIDAILSNLDKAHFGYKAIGDFGTKLIDRMEGGSTAVRA